jgi:hypothetical protein
MVYWVVVRQIDSGRGAPLRLGPFDSVGKAEAVARAHGERIPERRARPRRRIEIVCDYA